MIRLKVTLPKVTCPKVICPKATCPKGARSKVTHSKVTRPKVTRPKVTRPKVTRLKITLSKSDPSKSDTFKSDPSQSDTSKSNLSKSYPFKNYPSKIYPYKNDQAKKDQNYFLCFYLYPLRESVSSVRRIFFGRNIKIMLKEEKNYRCWFICAIAFIPVGPGSLQDNHTVSLYYLVRAMTRYESTCKTDMLTLSVKITQVILGTNVQHI